MTMPTAAVSGARRALTVGAAALACIAAAAWVGYRLRLYPSGVTIVWPPAGVMLGALLVLDRRDWRAALVGGFVANALVDTAHGAPFAIAVTGALANTFEEYVAALAVQHIGGRRVRLVSLREMGALIFGAAIASNAFTALAGAAVLLNYYETSFARAWLTWYAGDGLGMLILTPVVIGAVQWWETRGQESRRSAAEHAAFAGAAIAVALVVLQRPDGADLRGIESRAFLVVPVLIAAGLRLGPLGAAISTLGVAAVTVGYARMGALVVGTAASTWQVELLDVFTFLALAAVSSLIPAAVVADRARAIADLRRSEDRFRQIADNATEAFLIVDAATGRPSYTSPSWGSVWQGSGEGSYDPAAVSAATHPDDRARAADAWRNTLAGSPAEAQFRLMRPDGGWCWLRRRSFPVRDETGAVVRVVFLIEDVTQLRETEERYIQSQKLEAVGRLSSGVAHDFKNLLTVISTEAQILDAARLPEPHHASVAAILEATRRAATLTRELLTFARQQPPATPVPLDVNVTVRDMTRLFARSMGRTVRIEMIESTEAAWVRADRGQMEQVLANLLLNARDAMPDGGVVLAAVGCVTNPAPVDHEPPGPDAPAPDGWVEISVRDTGTGMSSEVIARTFEPFFTTKEVGRGTGLGLPTCQHIVAQWGGRMGITAKLGVGTTVRVLVPRYITPD